MPGQHTEPLVRNKPLPAPVLPHGAPPGAPLAHGLAPAAPHRSSVLSAPITRTPFHEQLAQARAKVHQAERGVRAIESPYARRRAQIAQETRGDLANANASAGGVRGHDPLLQLILAEQNQRARAVTAAETARAVRGRQNNQPPEDGGGLVGTILPFGVGRTVAHAVTGVVGPIARTLATVNPLPSGSGVLGTLGRIGNEAVDLPGQSFLSGEMGGAAGVEAVKGHPAAAEALAREILSQIEDPSFEQAPLSTALLLGGVEGGVGGLVGRVGRLGEKLDTAGNVVKPGLVPAFSRVRPDLKLLGDERLTLRQYNSDPLRKAAQVGFEKLLPHLPGSLRQADPFQAEGWRLNRNLVGGTFKVSRADRVAAASEDTRRKIVKGDIEKIAEANPGPGAQELSALVLQRALKTPASGLADLQKVRDLWAAEQDGLKGQKLATNRANVRRLDSVLGAPHAQQLVDRAFAADPAIEAIQKPNTGRLVHGNVLKEEQLRAALYPYGLLHMGLKHFSEADHAAAEAKAAAVEHEAQARLEHLEPGSPEHAHVAREVAAARAHRYEVSGRGAPEVQALHEHTVEQHHAALAGVRDAEVHLGKVQNARSRLVGARGRPRPRQDVAAAEGGGTAMDAADGRVRGAKERLAHAKAAEAEAREGVTFQPTIKPGLRTPEGKHVSNEEILEHMAANGVRPPGYHSHQLGIGGRSSFFKSTLKLPGRERFGRTGASFLNGTADHSFEALAGSIASQSSKAAQLEVRARVLRRLGIGGEHGHLYATEAEAREAADNFNQGHEGEQFNAKLGEVVPVHVGSGKVVEGANIHPNASTGDVLRQFGLEEHTPIDAKAGGKYVLMHKGVVDRLQGHESALAAKSDWGRFWQVYQQGFRRAKLNTSIPHVLGVLQEQAIRLAAEQVAPRGVGGFAGRAGHRFTRVLGEMAEVDREGRLVSDHGPNGAAFREIEGALANRGGLAGSQRANDVVRTKGNQFSNTSAIGYVMHGGQAVSKSRAAEVIGKPWQAWKAVVEGGLSRAEHQTRDALLAKALKDSGIIPSYRSLIHSTDEAVQALIEDRMTPQIADALAERIDNMGGNWNRQTPAVRALIGKYAPFGLWWLNSMRWLYRLPVTHPVKTAILAGLYQATREQRNKKGQGYDSAHPVPNFLQGTLIANLPVVGKAPIDLEHYSPGGAGGPEAFKVLLEQFLPAGRDIANAGEGINGLSNAELHGPTGKPLTIPEKALNVLNAVLTGPLPFATQIEKVLEHGGKPYGTADLLTLLGHEAHLGPSQVKPGTERSWPETLLELVSPIRFDFPTQGYGGPTSAPAADPYRRAIEQQQHGGANAGITEAWERAAAK